MTAPALSATPSFLHAQMIQPGTDAGVGSPAPFLSTTFELTGQPEQDTQLSITALGLYRCFINGKRVGNDLLTPGWTAYDLRLSYQTYAVADLLQTGTNHIEIWLADGWLRSQMMWRDVALFNTWGDKLAAMAEIRTTDNQVLVATSDRWKSGLTAIQKSGIYLGEHFDARAKQLEATQGVNVLEFDSSILVSHETTPVRELKPFKATSQWQDSHGRIIVDFGQNLAGYVRFTVEAQPGDQVLIEHSEIVGPNREFDNRNYRTAAAEIRYICKGVGAEQYQPHFTFMGYRYARVTLSGKAKLTSIESIPISSIQQQTGTFECGHPLVNRLVENTIWSQRSNFIEAPTDCPQRDERLGWTGDAQAFAPTACFLHDSHTFLSKWLNDVLVEQTAEGAIPHTVPNPVRRDNSKMPNFAGSTGWGDVIHVLPLTLWDHYGDRSALERSFPAMLRWIDFVWSISEGPIVRPPRNWSDRGFSFGDWLQPSGPTDKPHATMGDDAAATIYLYIALTNTARVARLLGDTDTEHQLLSKSEQVKVAFAEEFITPSGRIGYNDQTSYALAIQYNLVPKQHWGAVKRYFVDAIHRTGKTIGTGFIGTPALLPALIKIGEPELASELFLQESVPGWLYQVKQGATTIWERWDAIREDGTAFSPDMNSYNHYAYGAVCQWLFEGVAGIRPTEDQPGFKAIDFAPVILPSLGPVHATYQTHIGLISAAWSVEGDRVTYTINIPQGATGRFSQPETISDVQCNGQPASLADLAELGAGKHQISYRLQRLLKN